MLFLFLHTVLDLLQQSWYGMADRTSCYARKYYCLSHISLKKEQKNEEIHGKPLPSYQKNLNVARAVRELLIEITIQR